VLDQKWILEGGKFEEIENYRISKKEKTRKRRTKQARAGNQEQASQQLNLEEQPKKKHKSTTNYFSKKLSGFNLFYSEISPSVRF